MTVLQRVSQKQMEKRTGFKSALGYSFPKEDKILIRKDLPKDLEKKVLQHEEGHIAKGEEGPGLFDFIGNIFGASKQAKSADKATAAQERAAQEQIAFARESRNLARSDQAPYREAGYTALDALMSLTGLKPTPTPTPRPAQPPNAGVRYVDYLRGLGGGRGAGGRRIYGRALGGQMNMSDPRGRRIMYNVNETGPENIYQGGAMTRNPNPQTISQDGYVAENPGGVEGGYQFQTDPGYQFRLGEGMRALERGGAAAGGLLSGGFGRRAIRYGQDYASNEYTNVYNRIANIAGLGQVGASQSGQAALYTGSQMGNAAGNQGFARASGYAAQGNIWGNALQSGGQFLDDFFSNRRQQKSIDQSLNPMFSNPELF